jgi:hypothetical protein
MRALILWSCAMALTACGDGTTSDLPLVAGPIVPPATTRPSAEVLTSVGPTTLVGAPGASAVVQVQATKTDGTPVRGVLIVFEVQVGGGSVEPAMAETTDQGIASAKWTFGGGPGLNLLQATGGFNTTPVSFAASAIAPSASWTPDGAGDEVRR